MEGCGWSRGGDTEYRELVFWVKRRDGAGAGEACKILCDFRFVGGKAVGCRMGWYLVRFLILLSDFCFGGVRFSVRF